LISAFPNGIVPESVLGEALNNMADQWNNLLSQIITEVDQNQPISEHIKETAEFAVKGVVLTFDYSMFNFLVSRCLSWGEQ
jgi:hypothetical protein